jgi:hypothetical protein
MRTDLQDARECIFPIFSASAKDNGILIKSRVFLGTAFFVTKQGDAITASHVIPQPEDLKPGHRPIAVVLIGGKQQVCWITMVAKIESFDIALFKVNLENTKYLPVITENILAGTDIQIIGIPSHEVWGSGKEMRILKGHVTLSHTLRT